MSEKVKNSGPAIHNNPKTKISYVTHNDYSRQYDYSWLKLDNRYTEQNKFENITGNPTIINKSSVEKSFNNILRDYGEDMIKALEQTKEFIRKSGDVPADTLYDNFDDELNKPQPDKSVLQKLWSGIETLLPEIKTKSEQVSKISTLFH